MSFNLNFKSQKCLVDKSRCICWAFGAGIFANIENDMTAHGFKIKFHYVY